MNTTTEQATQNTAAPQIHRERKGVVGGLVLIVLGVLFLAERFVPDFHFGEYWPLILIAVGVGLLWKSRRPS